MLTPRLDLDPMRRRRVSPVCRLTARQTRHRAGRVMIARASVIAAVMAVVVWAVIYFIGSN